MAQLSVEGVLQSALQGLDEEILSYLQTIVEDLALTDRRSTQALYEAISPFLLDAGYSTDEEQAKQKCREIAVAFGGSGFTMAIHGNQDSRGEGDDLPVLLAAPVKMINQKDLLKPRDTSIDVRTLTQLNGEDEDEGQHSSKRGAFIAPEPMNIKDVPVTQREMRKQRRANEQLQKLLRLEALARLKQEEELAAARMAAIKASRTQGRQANVGVNIERFSIPHPSGTSDLLTDVSLTLTPGRRYGLVGKNGAGKSTLLRSLAGYKLPGLTHLRILLVDQHVEGDEATPLEWVLRADVERTALLEEEALLGGFLHGVQ